MKTNSIFKPAKKRLQAFSAMLIMMLCLSMTAQSKETAFAYLADMQGSTLKALIFDYKDISGYSFDHIWTGDKILHTPGEAPWKDFAEQIGEVYFLSSFKSQTPVTLQSWFEGCKNLKEIKGLENLNTSKVTGMSYTFAGCSSLTSLDLRKLDTSNLHYVRYMFDGCTNLKSIDISTFNTSQIRSFEYMFRNCLSLTSLNFKEFDFGNADSNLYDQVKGMFAGCSSLKSIDLTKFKNTSKLKSMAAMFSGCKSLESLVFPETFDTSNVTNMIELFYGCKGLTHIYFPESFNTSNVTTMLGMFRDCQSLTKLDLRYFNTAKVEDMEKMFMDMNSLEKLNIRSFQTNNVKDMQKMFSFCYKLKKLDLHNFITSNVEEMDSMFYFCNNLTNIYSGSRSWNTSASSREMFRGCTSLKGAISYSDSKVNNAYANPTDGYFTKTENYNLKICGEYVTNANQDDLSYIEGVGIQGPTGKEGHIYYENGILYLKSVIMETVDKPCIESMYGIGADIHVENNGNYDVWLIGHCSTPSAGKPVILLSSSDMIESNIYTSQGKEGRLTVNGDGVPGIVSRGPLYISRTTVDVKGTYGICGGTEGIESGSFLSILDNTNVTARGSVGGSICNFEEVMIWGMITYPEGAYCDGNAVVLNGQIEKSMVAIGKAVYGYGIFINGQEVNSANCRDLSVIEGVTLADEGYLWFNLNTNTLEMSGCGISGGIRNTFNNLTIKLGDTMSIIGASKDQNLGAGLLVQAPTTITGSGGALKGTDEGVYFIGEVTGIQLANDSRLQIRDAAVVGMSSQGVGITGTGTLDVKGLSFVRAQGPLMCLGSNSNLGGSINLELGKNVKITEPYGAVFANHAVRSSNGEEVKGEYFSNDFVLIRYYNPADVNLDQDVNISDVVAVINTMAGDKTFESTADVNSDKDVNISDVVMVINVMAGGKVPLPKPQDAASEAGYCPDANHPHVIDLGSAGKWSCCNVGAKAPWEYGGYYAWGETEEKSTYNWNTYKHCGGNNATIYDIGTNIAGTQYDVAHVKWGGNWQMPTYEQGRQLSINCSGEITTLNNVPGRKYTGSNGKYIFLPAPGTIRPTGLDQSDVDVHGWYWTSVPVSNLNESIYGFWFYNNGTVNYGAVASRFQGLPVRPVSK